MPIKNEHTDQTYRDVADIAIWAFFAGVLVGIGIGFFLKNHVLG